MLPSLAPHPFPDLPAPLEEAWAPAPRDVAATFAFALSRRPVDDARPVLVAATAAWLNEHGRPYGPGLGDVRLLLTRVRREVDALWAMEQALRSGAVALTVGAIHGAALTQTRRLEFAARQGGATALLLPRDLDGLSAAARRWRITAESGAADPDDPRAPGATRLCAELVRARNGRPGRWTLEQDDETHRLRLADRLADRGQAPIARTGAPSGLAA